MRICLIGNYYSSMSLDEGLSNIGFHLYHELKKEYIVLHLSVKNVFSVKFWKEIKRFNPDIIHYIPGTSIRNLVLLKIIKIIFGNVKTITSVHQPNFTNISKMFISFFKTDLALAFSQEVVDTLNNRGLKTKLFYNGVDCNKFTPVEKTEKKLLRERYKINDDDFVIFHTGPMKKWRNPDVLLNLQKIQGVQVLTVASLSNPSDESVIQKLRKFNCIVLREYFSNIEDIYRLSDCYIFPVTHRLGCMQIPLSVLEAMACNLPIITSKYGALAELFKEGNGLYFVDDDEKYPEILNELRYSKLPVKTREHVLSLTWENVTKDLGQVYKQVLS